MQELQSINDIVITDANKGRTIVILGVEDYVKEAERQLNNKERCKTINYHHTAASNDTVNKVIPIF